MAYEQRGNQRYYYRKQRDGKVVKSIYGGKILPSFFEQFLEEKDQVFQSIHAFQQQLKKDQQEIETELKAYERCTLALRQGILLAAGYHSHKGQWRKKRASKEAPSRD